MKLEPLREEDCEPMFAWINDRDLVVLNGPFAPVDRASHDAWFDRIRAAEDVEIFGIRTGAHLIGSCQLNGIDRRAGSAQLQIRIADRSMWGRGHGTEAVRALLARAFGELGLSRVGLQVIEGNDRAIRAYEKAGFRRTGVVPGGVEIDGEALDLIEMEAVAGG